MASKYYFVIKLLRNAVFFYPSHFSTSQSGRWILGFAAQFGIFSTCKGRRIRTRCGGRVAWVALWRAFSQTQRLVFWWFLRIYLTSALFSCWYFLLLKQRIFWYYSSLQVMAILCWVAKKAASAAQGAWENWFMKKTRSKKSCDTVPLKKAMKLSNYF